MALVFELEDLQVDNIPPHMQQLATRNGKGVEKFLAGGFYYCLAAKRGAVLSHSPRRMWEARAF